jgi:hypothetical protein
LIVCALSAVILVCLAMPAVLPTFLCPIYSAGHRAIASNKLVETPETAGLSEH